MSEREGLPLVSAVVAIHGNDCPDWLRTALDSLRHQQYERLEIIAVADGPLPEAIRDVLAPLREDSRVRRESLPVSRGPSAARNWGIEAAQGEYVAVLDSDDVAAPDRIVRQVAAVRAGNLDAVGCFYRVVDETGGPLGRRRLPVHPDALRRWAWLVNPLGGSLLLARRYVLASHRYDERIRYGEDYDLALRLLAAGVRVGNVPEFLVDVRTGENFWKRRRGRDKFRSDWRNRRRAVALLPVYARPVALLAAWGLAAARVAPSRLLRALYGIRAGLRF